MRVQTATIAMLLLGMLTGATAGAADPAWSTQRDKSVMLYFAKSFGGSPQQNPSPYAFGLRLQRDSLQRQDLPQLWTRPMPLLDLRYSFGAQQTFAVNGLRAFDSADSSASESQASSDLARRHPGWTAALIIVTVAAAACVFKTGICEDDSRRESPGLESPGLGSGG